MSSFLSAADNAARQCQDAICMLVNKLLEYLCVLNFAIFFLLKRNVLEGNQVIFK